MPAALPSTPQGSQNGPVVSSPPGQSPPAAAADGRPPRLSEASRELIATARRARAETRKLVRELQAWTARIRSNYVRDRALYPHD